MSESKLKVQVLEGTDNKLDLAKLEDVLKRKLIIPSYQRPYAWKLEDMKEIFQTILNERQSEEKIYFFGSIILSEKGGGFGQEEYYIIDGQQRVSSFLLILRVILNELKKLQEKLKPVKNQEYRKNIESKLEGEEKKLSEIIQTVSLKREGSGFKDETSILKFIKSGDDNNLPDDLKKIKDVIHDNVIHDNTVPDSSNVKLFDSIDENLKFLDLILNKIKFCLICISGKNSEDFAINLFNTLNTTGQPLTAFEVLKSELYTIDQELSQKIDEIQSKIIKYHIFKRKKIVTHTGKLLLYLALYRGDFDEKEYTLSDNKFKNQRGYLKKVLNPDSARQLVEDIESIDKFYSTYWLKRDSYDSLRKLLKNDDEQVCFHFLSELTHDRVLPILILFHNKNKAESLGQSVKICTAFSSLWRAYCDGATSGIDKVYKDISSNNISSKIKDFKIETLRKSLKEKFLKKLSSDDDIKQAKSEWIKKMKTSTIYKNQTLSKLLLFLAYNQTYFSTDKKSLTKGKGINILNIYYWKHSDFKTIEHITPQSNSKSSQIHTLGNLTLLPKALNSSVGNKPFLKKREQYKQFCSKNNEENYPYLPIIKHIAHYNQFEKKEIEERSKILSEFIWQTLAEDWLGWK